MSFAHKSDVNLILLFATEINNNVKKSMQSLSVSGIQVKDTFVHFIHLLLRISTSSEFDRPTTKRLLLVSCSYMIIIRLEARLQANIGFTFERTLTVFTRSDKNPPKANRFGWNLEHSEYIVWGWLWQILGSIRAVARDGKPGNFLFFFCQVNNARLYRFPVGQISRNLNTTRRSVSQ